jgi:phosphatidylglycerophosphate synthase
VGSKGLTDSSAERYATHHPVRTMSHDRAAATLLLSYAKERDVNDELGAGFWLKLAGLVVACGIGALLLFLLVDAAWARWGGLGALLFFFVVMITWGYFYDRKHVKEYEDLEA